jgi:prophage antirepressor-like protein
MVMQFEKRNFMGIELDVLVGHPEHDLLFVATQVARAAGLKNPSHASMVTAKALAPRQAMQLGAMQLPVELAEGRGHTLKATSWLFNEASVYRLLMRGSTDKAKAFQDWLAEEVVPSIRKTGKYNAEESTNPIAQSIMDELKCLRSDIAALRQELSAKTFSLEAPVAAPEPSPYEGQLMVALCDPAGFNARTYRELAGETIPRPAVDKLESQNSSWSALRPSA